MCDMGAAVFTSIHPRVRTRVTREDLNALAEITSASEEALSLYFCWPDVRDTAHHEEKLLLRNLVHNTIYDVPSLSAAFAEDMRLILAAADDIRLDPRRMHAIFACGSRHVWQEFSLPVAVPQGSLHRGRRFSLLPLARASASLDQYVVVLAERGKMRLFTICGTEIEEISGYIPSKRFDLPAQDSRVGWSSHFDGNQLEQERAYFKMAFHHLRDFLDQNRLNKLIIGCRNDLWGELEPRLPQYELHMPIGRFYLPSFAVSTTEVLDLATPLVEQDYRVREDDLFKQMNRLPARAAYGVNDVQQALTEGRVHTLVVGKPSDETIMECRSCGRSAEMSGEKCAFCGGTDVQTVDADETLLRLSLRTDAEVLFAREDEGPALRGPAALLRY